MIFLSNETYHLSVGEARDLVIRLRHASVNEGWKDADVVHLLAFLERAANVLEEDKTEEASYRKFDNWGRDARTVVSDYHVTTFNWG